MTATVDFQTRHEAVEFIKRRYASFPATVRDALIEGLKEKGDAVESDGCRVRIATRTLLPFEVYVGSPYGSPHGRCSDHLSEFKGCVHLREVPFVDGDYDQGGAYWGGGTIPLFCAWDDEGHVHYLRARVRWEAKDKILLANPALKFYR